MHFAHGARVVIPSIEPAPTAGTRHAGAWLDHTALRTAQVNAHARGRAGPSAPHTLSPQIQILGGRAPLNKLAHATRSSTGTHFLMLSGGVYFRLNGFFLARAISQGTLLN